MAVIAPVTVLQRGEKETVCVSVSSFTQRYE